MSAVLTPAARERYADALVLYCLGLAEGDTLFVHAHPAHRELVVALAESAYRAGAGLVEIRYADPLVQAARVRYGSDEILGPSPDWSRRMLREHLKPTSAIVHVMGEGETGVFDDLPPARVAEDTMRPLRKLVWYVRAVKADKRRWAAIAWPTAYWAGVVYPELDEDAAKRKLADDLLWFCRLGPDDPPGHAGWEQHVEAIARRAAALTELELERVELRGPGTELELGLSARTRWIGGREENAHGQRLSPNFPTEECFTSPQAGAADGTFRCTRPLSFHGRDIDGIAGEFRSGRLVRLEASTDEDRDYLAAFLDIDPGARRLGEVALVDRTSRIGRTGRTYFNTLLDENAAAHIAFGFGFDGARTVEPGRRAAGVNRSNLHLDVMIGTDDLEATGIAAGGRRVPLIAGGTWAL
jgi:aminopeptidase